MNSDTITLLMGTSYRPFTPLVATPRTWYTPRCPRPIDRDAPREHRSAKERDNVNFLERRYGEVRRTHHRRTSGSVKLHSWVTTLGQQGTEVQGGRSSTSG